MQYRGLFCFLTALGMVLGLGFQSPAAAQDLGASPSQGEALAIDTVLALAASQSDQVQARNAAALAALKAVDAAKAQMLPKLSASLSGAYLPYDKEMGITVPKGSLGTLPLWVPASGNPGTYYSGPFTEYQLSMPNSDLVLQPTASNQYYKANLSLSQPLFAWGKIMDSIQLSMVEARLSQAAAEGASRDAAREANRAYYSAILADRSATILAELCGLADQIIADRQQSLDEGLGTKAQVLAAKADRAELEARLVEARQMQQSSREALSTLIGMDASSTSLVSDFRGSPGVKSEAQLKDASARSSTDFVEAGLKLEEARRQLSLAKDSVILRPDVGFFTNLDVSGTSTPYASSNWTTNWALSLSIGINIAGDLFDGGASGARVSEAAAGTTAAQAALNAAGKAARLAARQAIEAASKGYAQLQARQARADYQAEVLKSAQASAADQLTSRSELLGAKIAEAGSRLDLLAAQYAFEEALADEDRISGEAAAK